LAGSRERHGPRGPLGESVAEIFIIEKLRVAVLKAQRNCRRVTGGGGSARCDSPFQVNSVAN
jgi:hypothetical protein